MQQAIPRPKPFDEENEFLDPPADPNPDREVGLESVRPTWFWGFFVGTALLISALVLYALMVLSAGLSWFPPPPPALPALGG